MINLLLRLTRGHGFKVDFNLVFILSSPTKLSESLAIKERAIDVVRKQTRALFALHLRPKETRIRSGISFSDS